MTFGLSGAALAGIAVGGATLVSGMMGANAAEDAANAAAGAQRDASNAGIAEQRRQFDAIKQLLQPYVDTGADALGGMRELIGLDGSAVQRSAIAGLESSPEFIALARQGENGILQNASATGGLRGGNVQAALAQFRPNMLASLIEQQYRRLGGLASFGQNAAAGVGNAGLATGNNVANLLQQVGAANAGAAIAGGQAAGQMWGAIPNALASGFGAFSGLGGSFGGNLGSITGGSGLRF